MLKKAKDIKVLKKTNPCDEWTLDMELGKGSFGEVYLAKNSANEVAAAKICVISCEADFADMKQEVEILTLCDHINILKAKSSYYYTKKIWMILEYCSGGALDDVIEKVDGFDERTIKAALYQCFLGLEYLHKNAIIHRDIKAGNIMLTETGILKIADFGVSALMASPNEMRNTFIGTPYWMPPEAILTESLPNQKYGTKADIWSMGVTIIEMAEVLPPNCDFPPPQVMLLRIRSEPPSFKEPEKWSAELNNLLELTLLKDPNKRLSATQCLQHAYLQGDEPKSLEPLVEAYRMCKAYDSCEEVEDLDENVIDVDEQPSDEADSGKSTAKSDSRSADNRSALRTIRKTIKIEINGQMKSKTIVRVVDDEHKDQKERDKSMRIKVMNQMKALKIEEHRELKKLENSQKVQLNDLTNKSKTDFESLMEKYYSECDNINKHITKEIDKRRSQIKNDLEKAFKKLKQHIEKEKKTQASAQKSKNKKYDKCYYEEDYIQNLVVSTCESFTKQRETELEEFRKFYVNLVSNKNDQLEEVLKNVVLTKFSQTLDMSQLKRTHISAILELVLQHRIKSNQKELAMTIKFMNDKVDAIKREQAREIRELPKVQRNRMKKELDAYKKSLRQQKVKNEKELLAKKQDEIIEILKQETNVLKIKQHTALKYLEDQNETMIREIGEYHEQKNISTHSTYQEQLYALCNDDEIAFKNEILKMYHLRKCREQEFEMDLSLAKAANIDVFSNITVDLFN